MRWQTVDKAAGRIINHTTLGRRVQAFARDSGSVLPGYGFLDGGCLVFAAAMQRVVRGLQTGFACVGRPDICDHVVLRIRLPDGAAAYLDADGLAGADELLQKMRQLEGLASPVLRDVGLLTLRRDWPLLPSELQLQRELAHRWLASQGPITPQCLLLDASVGRVAAPLKNQLSL